MSPDSKEKGREVAKVAVLKALRLAEMALVALLVCMMAGCMTLTLATRDGNGCIKIPIGVEFCLPTDKTQFIVPENSSDTIYRNQRYETSKITKGSI